MPLTIPGLQPWQGVLQSTPFPAVKAAVQERWKMSEQEKDFFEQAMADVVPLASGRQTLYLKPQETLDKSARREAQRLRQENFLSTDFLEVDRKSVV